MMNYVEDVYFSQGYRDGAVSSLPRDFIFHLIGKNIPDLYIPRRDFFFQHTVTFYGIDNACSVVEISGNEFLKVGKNPYTCFLATAWSYGKSYLILE